MKAIKQFSTRYPLLFLLFIVIGWYILNFITLHLSGSSQPGPIRMLPLLIQMFSSLGYIILIAIILGRVGWLRPAGVIRLGSWQVWLVAPYILVYKIPTLLYAHFGSAAFSTSFSSFAYLLPFYINDFLETPSGVLSILYMFIFSIIIESIYRGLVLYAFTLAWGKTKLGLLAGALASALVFGILSRDLFAYYFQPGGLLVYRLIAVLSGIWLAALVLRWGSIWPGIILSTLINLTPIIATDFTRTLQTRYGWPVSTWLILFEIPLVLLGIWLILRTPPRPAAGVTLSQESAPPANPPPAEEPAP